MPPTTVGEPSADSTANIISKEIDKQSCNYQEFEVTMRLKLKPACPVRIFCNIGLVGIRGSNIVRHSYTILLKQVWYRPSSIEVSICEITVVDKTESISGPEGIS